MCFFPFCTPVEQNRTDHIRHKKEMQHKIDHGSCLRYLPCFSQPQGSTDSVHGRRDHQEKSPIASIRIKNGVSIIFFSVIMISD